MAFFAPQTTIYLCQDTGIDDNNKPYFSSNAGMVSWLMGKAKTSFTQYSYQRADERQYCIVDYDFYEALNCDIIMWQNAGHSQKWIIANITGIEWMNPNATKIYFEVDPYCTFCGDIEWQASMVEREHVDNDWNGDIPIWTNQGVAENISADADNVAFEDSKYLETNSYIVLSPYDQMGEVNFSGDIKFGIYQGLTENVQTGIGAPQYINAQLLHIAQKDEANLQNVLGIFSVPDLAINGGQETTETTPPWNTYSGQFNNSKVYCSQFCCCQVDTMCGNSQTYKPELFGAASSINFITEGYFIGGTGGFLFYPSLYANTDSAKEYACVINSFPSGSWVGNNYAQWAATNGTNAFIQGLVGVVGAGLAGAAVYASGGLAAGLLTALSGGIGSISNYETTVAKAQKASALVGGTQGANANLSQAAGIYGFIVRWMTPRMSIMKSIDNYFDKYGYRVNLLKVPNVNTRPQWNYVKTTEAHIGGNFPKAYRTAIEGMLNKGVTFWHTGAVEIGDYSNPAGNKQ